MEREKGRHEIVCLSFSFLNNITSTLGNLIAQGEIFYILAVYIIRRVIYFLHVKFFLGIMAVLSMT